MHKFHSRVRSAGKARLRRFWQDLCFERPAGKAGGEAEPASRQHRATGLGSGQAAGASQRLKPQRMRDLLGLRERDGTKPMRETYSENLLEQIGTTDGRAIDWRKSMSDTVAYSLLVYTTLQIFVTLRALDAGGGSLLPMVALVVLVAGVIPLFRIFERRWEALDDMAASNPALRGAFRRDQIATWAVAIGLPFLLTALFRAISAIS
jgi:hypothetical protein